MLTKEQLEIRKTGLGGSDMAVVLGLSPYKSRYELFLEKTGQVEPENLDDNDLVQFGNMIEDQIAIFYTYKTGLKLRRNNNTMRHEKYPWILANIDRKIEGMQKGVEIKNVSSHAYKSWGKDGSKDVAEYYIPQVICYQLVTGYRLWDVAAYFGGADLRLYPLERDLGFEQLIIDESHDFWHNHVLKNIPPEIDYDHPTTEAVLKRLFPGTNGSTIDLDDRLIHWNHVREQAAEQIKIYKAAQEAAKNHINAAMGSAAIGKLSDGSLVLRSQTKRKEALMPATTFMVTRFKKAK